tara:strand:- start:2652 stop:2879 length:228 start_codon:yes stop_codon:yes gene_type:complete
MNLLEKLEKGIVLITFESLKSGKTYSREYTLKEEYMSNPTTIMNQSGDKLLCYDVEFKKWEDIDIETIRDWKVVE